MRIALAEKKIEYQMVEVAVGSGQPVHAYNPLGKVPVLILDDGTHLFDSRVIVEYIDLVSPVSRLIPEPARQRIAVKRWEALADGVCDAAAAIVVERRRPEHCKATNGSIASAARSAKAIAELSRELGDRRGATAKRIRWPTSRPVARSAISTFATPSSTGASPIRTSSASPKSSASARRSPKRPLRGHPGDAPRRSALQRLLQLIEDRRILERRDVLRDLLALRDRAQQAPHDLARARLRQVVAEADVLRLRDRPDFLADPVAQFLRDLRALRRLPGARASARRTRRPLRRSCRRAGRRRRLPRPADSATSADSISIVPSRWPDTFSTSSMRPMIVK